MICCKQGLIILIPIEHFKFTKLYVHFITGKYGLKKGGTMEHLTAFPTVKKRGSIALLIKIICLDLCHEFYKRCHNAFSTFWS